MKTPILTSFALVGALMVTGCAATGPAASQQPATAITQASDQTGAEIATINNAAEPNQWAANDAESVAAALSDNKSFEKLQELTSQTWAASEEITITLSGASASASSDQVGVNGSVITISTPGTYRINGALDDGQIIVDSPGDGVVRLILDNAEIASSTGAAIAIPNADLAAIVLADGSHNSLTDTANYADQSEDAPNATLWSSDDLAIFGPGALHINGLFNDGINARDGLVIDAGNLTIDALDDGIRGKDYLTILGGQIDLTAGGDGLKSDATRAAEEADKPMVGYVAILDGDISVAAGDDAVTAAAEVIIGGGNITVSRSYEGLEAAQVLLAGGNTVIYSSDDGVNAASDIYRGLAINISGGTLMVTADGDGLDSNGDITQTGGVVVVNGANVRNESSIDASGIITLHGGTMLATGSAGMLDSPSTDSTQGWLVAPLPTAVSGGTRVQIIDATGTEIARYTAGRDFEAITYSDAQVRNGASYTIVADNAQVATVTAGESAARGGPGNGGPRRQRGNRPGGVRIQTTS